MPSLKKLSSKPNPLVGGHRACSGCVGPLAIRQALLAAENPVVAGIATGCMEVVTTIFPYTSWQVPLIHNAFENVAATISGVEAAYRALKRKGKLGDKKIEFIAFAGDGGTYDIGLQALSGAVERGHDMLYICYDNEAYMNTGIQRSGATPRWAHTTTAPAGAKIPGKTERRKNLTEIMVAHEIPYVAQACPSFWNDYAEKVQKALAVEGPAFINVLAPCNVGWGFEPEESIEIGRLAVETCFWPLYEVVNGKYRLTYKPKQKRPLREWLERQARFRHLFQPGNEALIEDLQREVDEEWEKLLRRCQESATP